MGVASVDTSVPDCLRVTYDSDPKTGATRTLALFFCPDGLLKAEVRQIEHQIRMLKRPDICCIQLENSVERIDDLVAQAKKTGDIRLLVHGVRNRHLGVAA